MLSRGVDSEGKGRERGGEEREGRERGRVHSSPPQAPLGLGS